MTPQSGNRVSTSLCWTVFAWNRDTAVPAEGNGDLQTLICPCGETQTMSHIVKSCPLTKLNGSLSRLHSVDEDAVSWLTSYGSWHAYEKKKKSVDTVVKKSTKQTWKKCFLKVYKQQSQLSGDDEYHSYERWSAISVHSHSKGDQIFKQSWQSPTLTSCFTDHTRKLDRSTQTMPIYRKQSKKSTSYGKM